MGLLTGRRRVEAKLVFEDVSRGVVDLAIDAIAAAIRHAVADQDFISRQGQCLSVMLITARRGVDSELAANGIARRVVVLP